MGSTTFLQVLCMAIVGLGFANAEVPAVFVLGDSTADVGTNNFLPGFKARADFPPNGIDFPHSRPTGRFSNGFNSADFLAMLLGFKRSPLPFFALAGNPKLIKRPSFRGVNFASGGSGILDITGQTALTSSLSSVKNVVPLREQIEQLSAVHDNITALKGSAYTEILFSKSLFFISIGSNDLLSYFYSNSSVPKQEFISALGLEYEKQIMSIIELGARKIGIISVPPVGCCPSQRAFNESGGCLEGLNDLALEFHSTIDALLMKLGSEYTDLKYSLGNTYEMTINVIDNPFPFGFKEVQTACCGIKRFNGQGICDKNANLCPNRHDYLFWDLFHPTMNASKLAALTLYAGEPRFVSPINFKQLAEA
ncbi:hypothetical protein SADUNF_Sadunf04G0129200 [Salix dunnii]|uniref:GDSL esterase/lipase n=1 Tax=Salix dunnii TaxID=1413687 RepID=A0A835N131_9ROSI|nr:hypothetical protein SADUNF_Sadunf04G0129200 [Salix dunnii]